MENFKSMEDMLDQIEASLRMPRKGEVLKGTVVYVRDRELVVNVGYKADGIVPVEEISINPNFDIDAFAKPGDEIDVMIIGKDDGEGNLLLSIKRIAMTKDFDVLEEAKNANETVKVKAMQVVKGGIVAYYKELRGFIPASHIDTKFVKDLTPYVGKEYEVKIIELNKKKRKVVFSRKEILSIAERAIKEKFWNEIEANKVIRGKVKRITDFGAFVDIGGFDGLVHLSEISWGRVSNIREFLTIDQDVDVKILSFDKEKEKISLSIKQVKSNPWDTFQENYEVGKVVDGRVVNLTDFGAFIEIEPGLEGLVHVSQISKERVEKPADKLSMGETVQVKITDVNLEEKKIKLSIKEALEPVVAEESAE